MHFWLPPIYSTSDVESGNKLYSLGKKFAQISRLHPIMANSAVNWPKSHSHYKLYNLRHSQKMKRQRHENELKTKRSKSCNCSSNRPRRANSMMIRRRY